MQQKHKFFLKKLQSQPELKIAINVSGGKDSQAMLSFINQLFPNNNKFAIHAHLGRMEWQETLPFTKHLCQKQNIKLIVVKAEKDLIGYFMQRFENLKIKGEEQLKPFWSDAKNRYCTSQAKIAPINKHLRKYKLILNCIGIRAEESRSRRLKKPLKIRKDISSTIYKDLSLDKAFKSYLKNPNKRLVVDYYPIFDWNLERVWQECGTSTENWNKRRKLPDHQALKGWTAHPAYVLGKGNERLSCCFCVLGNLNDLTNAIKYNPETYNILCDLEQENGWTFQAKRSLSELKNMPTQLTIF